MAPTPSRRDVPARALKGQQGPGAHLPPYFEANPLHIELDGTLPGLSGKGRSTSSVSGACPPLIGHKYGQSGPFNHSEQAMNEGIATGCKAPSSELVPKTTTDTKFTFQL